MSSRASLNHVYRTVWNEALGAMVAVAEIASAGGHGTNAGGRRRDHRPGAVARLSALALGIAAAWLAGPANVLANPSGGSAIVGQASMVNQGNKLTVTTQNGALGSYSAINWQNFSIPAGSTTYFQQPSTSSTSINRVVTNNPSQIFGTLGSNGNLVLVNQSGITVGAGAVVDSAGFTASSLRMSDADALAARMRFGDGTAAGAGVSVQGSILARSGDVVLLGSQLDTGKDALIQAPNGSTILAAGRQIEITGRGLEGISLQVQAPADSAVNLGTLRGDAVGIFAGTLKHSGFIQAQAVSVEGGKVFLKGLDALEVGGKISAQSLEGRGGVVHATANQVLLTSDAVIDVNGASAGGEALIGGGWHGEDARLGNARQTVVAAGAQIRADATDSGNGGTIVVWADHDTGFAGSLSARGGAHGGDGGRAEVSGKQYLDFRGDADLTAHQGQSGTLLLDPDSITIGTVDNVDGFGGQYQGGAITEGQYSGYGSQILATTVSSLLGTGSLSLAATGNITVSSQISKTTGSATTLSLTSTTGTVNLGAPIGYSGSGPLSLELNTAGSITQGYGAAITVASLTATATANFANLTFTESNNVGMAGFSAGATGYGGNVSFKNVGALDLASITAASLAITTTNGAVTQTGAAPITLAGGATFTTGTGNITLDAGSNQFGSIAVPSAGGVSLTDTSGSSLTLNNVTSGSLSVAANGNILISGSLAVGGAVYLHSSGVEFGNISFSPQTGPRSISASGVIKLEAAKILDIGLGTLSSTAAGDAVVMIAGSDFLGSGGTITPSTSGGRWLAYLKDPDPLVHTFPVNSPPQFKQYNAAYGSTVLGSGNGVLYNNSNPAVLTAGQTAPLDALTGAVSKVYDGSVDISMSGASYIPITAGMIDGDVQPTTISIGATGTLADPSVGTGKQVTASVTGVTSSAATGSVPVYGYRIRGNIGEVTPAHVISSISLSGSRVYDGSNVVNADIFSLSGLVTGETLTLSGSGTVADKNVGVNKPVSLGSLTLGDGTGSASNYTFSGGSQVATITRAPVTASGITASSKVYDGTTVAAVTGGSLLGVVSGDSLALSLGAGNFNDKNVGIAKPVTVTGLALRGADAVNYALTSSSASLSADITPKGLTVSGVTAANKVYDGSTLATLSGGVLSGVVSGDSLSLGGASGSFNDKNIGKAKAVTVTGLTLAGADAANYTLGSSNSLSADITPKDLAVSVVTAASKVYDGSTAATLSGGVLSGAVAGDAVALGTPTGTFSDKNIGLGKTVAITGLTLSGSDAPNYTLGSVTSSTSADITPKAVTASPVSAANKVYDGSTAATLSGGVLSGAVAGDAVALGLPSGTFSDKNAGLGKTVAITGLSLSGSDATNYRLGGVTTSTTADISKAAITAVSGIVVNDKVYDGKTTATVLTSSANLAGMVAGDQLTVGSVESVFVDRNVGRGKVVNLSNLTLSGQDAANYTVPVNITPVSGNITVRPLATWTAPGSGQWSTAANWDALPDASNVLAVAIPAGVTAAYDAAVGATQLQSVSGNFSLAGGNLSIAGGLSTAQYGQTGGALSLGAAFTVNGSFSQTGGTIAAIGPVAITQGSGNLTVAAINAPSISLAAPTGSISQSAALVTPGLLSTRSLGSTLLTDVGNRVGSFNASSTGVGDIALTSVGAIDVQGINAATGNVTLFNTGGISTSGPVLANGGAVSMTANSPLTIGTGGISAMGNIDLLASNLTSAGNLTLNGDLLSIAGAISLTAANNFVQNAGVSAALGVTVSAGGSVTLGPLAHTFSNAISYGVNGVSVATPPGSQTTGSTPTDFVATFMTQFERAIVVSAVFGVEPLLPTRTDRRAIAVEGDVCSR